MSKQVLRFDRGKFETAERTPQGFLRVPAYVTRAGVFTYKTGDGKTIREFRPAAEVFSKESMDSLAGSPVTLKHPPAMLTPKNVKQYQVGYAVEQPRQDGDKISIPLVVADEGAINAVEKAGLREVSCGYYADSVAEPGEFDGQAYDFVQKNIRYNHIAIVEKGRAGRDVRIRLDAADAVMKLDAEEVEEEPIINKEPEEELKVENITINGKEFQVSPELKTAISTEMNKSKETMDEFTKTKEQVTTLQKEKDDLTKTHEATQAKLDVANEELKKRVDSTPDENKIRELAKSRMGLEKVATHILPKDQVEKLDSMSDTEIKRAVIMVDSPTAQLEGKSDVYIDTRFDSVAEKVRARADFNTNFGKAVTVHDIRKDEAQPDPNAARKKSREADEKEWQKPLSATKA